MSAGERPAPALFASRRTQALDLAWDQAVKAAGARSAVRDARARADGAVDEQSRSGWLRAASAAGVVARECQARVGRYADLAGRTGGLPESAWARRDTATAGTDVDGTTDAAGYVAVSGDVGVSDGDGDV